MPNRPLPLTGSWNTRDLGGFTTSDGRRVVHGKLFRSDGLDLLTGEDKAILTAIPIKTVVDFRSDEEQRRHPDLLPDSVDRYVPFPITPGTIRPSNIYEMSSSSTDNRLMQDIYRMLVSDEASLSQYRQFFRLLQDGDGLPLLFHCSAGKDRTGLAAALIFSALAVGEEDIMRDYLASGEYLDGKYPSNEGIFSVAPDYLRAAADVMTQYHGSIPGFMEQVLDVDIARMRALFLE